MEKTINCADEQCAIAFTYEPNPHYPDKRKYCDQCSARRKESYAKFKNASESKPTHTPLGVPVQHANHAGTWPKPKEPITQPFREDISDMYQEEMKDIVTEKIPDQTVSFSSKENGQIGLEYEIRSREVRCRALASAIEVFERSDITEIIEKLDYRKALLDLAKVFEKYILGEE